MKVADIFLQKDIDLAIADFLDYFYHADTSERIAAIQNEPVQNPTISASDYAYVAAMVEKLCNDFGLDNPSWIEKKKYFLSTPWFPPHVKGRARIYLMLYSPVEFLRRNLFVSENVLSRV